MAHTRLGIVSSGAPVYLMCSIVCEPDPLNRARGVFEDRLAADAAADDGLHPQLPRSDERELRGAHDEPGDWPHRHAVRARIGAVLLPGLLLPRSAEQRGALPLRSAAVAVAHHDQLGP